MINNVRRTYTPMLTIIIFILTAVIFLTFPATVAKGAAEGLKTCAAVIIPCLFPFTVASVFVHKSGGIMWIGKKLNRFSKAVFGISGYKLTAVFLSLIGGYPIGAKIVDNMYSGGEITNEEAKRLICFSVNASPAFFISTVGATLLGSKKAGFILFISNTVSCLLLTAATGKITNKKGVNEKIRETDFYTIGDSLVLSVSDSAQIFINISAWVTLFSVITEVVKLAGFSANINLIISVFLEVTVGCINAANIGVPFYIYSFILSFGGLSTICQVCSAAANVKPSFIKITICRILHGILSALISYLLFKAFPISQETLNNSVNVVFSGFEPGIAPVFLILTAILYLIYLKK